MQTTDNHEGHHPSSDLNRPSHPQDLRTSTLTILTVTRVATAHAAEEAPELDLLTIPPRWALSPLDWQAHAVDPWADHLLGVWIARCGHQLLSGTTLHDTHPAPAVPPVPGGASRSALRTPREQPRDPGQRAGSR